MREKSQGHKVTRSQVTRGILMIFAVPFLCGFSFLSDLKNEEGNKLYKKGQVGKAKSAYLSAAKTDPKSPTIAYNLGNALFKENNFKNALAAYQKSTVPAPSNDPLFRSKAFYNLGNSAYRAQDLEKAAESYKQALRANPDDKDAKYNLELVLKKLKKNEQKKDQDKPKDQPKDQPKKDQKKDQGSGGGKGDKQDQGGKGDDKGDNDQQKKEGGEKGDSKQDKSEDKGEEKSAGGQSGQKDKDQKEGEEQEATEEPEGDQGQGQGQENEKDKKGDKTPTAVELKPVSEADLRAEQILRALENQEQQVLKFQNDPKNPRQRVQRVSEQDW